MLVLGNMKLQGEQVPPLRLLQKWNLVHGDCLRVLPTLAEASVDAIITDPPYSSAASGNHRLAPRRKYREALDQRSWTWWCCQWMAQLLRVARPGALLIVFSDWRQLPSVRRGHSSPRTRSTCPRAGTRPAGAARRGAGGCRPRSCPSSPRPARSSRTPAARRWPGAFRIPIKRGDRHHLTGKPVDLLEQLVELAPSGGLVVDPFSGSGTTGVAALRRGRRFFGIELSAHYHQVAQSRLEQAALELA